MGKSLHGVLLILSLALVGCASKPAPPFTIKEPRRAMLYGHMELRGESVQEVEIQQYGKFYLSPFISPPRVLVYNDGTFVAENLKPGKYIIARVRSLDHRYDLARDKRHSYQRILHVEPGSLTYAGSYHVRKVKAQTSGIIGRNDIQITQLQRPGERDVLKELYRITEGTAWQNKVTDRLKQLRQ